MPNFWASAPLNNRLKDKKHDKTQILSIFG